MSELESEAMEAEFGTVAGWTEQAVRILGPAYAIPAGCRGSGSEGALRWLADRLALHQGTRLLDDGAGVGGPAGWLAADRGLRPVCADPMAAAARAARRLFGLPSVVAPAQQLPFADDCFGAAWCLGVLCTTSDKAGALAELRRVLKPGGELRFMEHVRADSPRKALLQRWLDRTGIWPRLAGGCHCARDTIRAIEAAGFAVERVGTFDLGPSWITTNPHVLGAARVP